MSGCTIKWAIMKTLVKALSKVDHRSCDMHCWPREPHQTHCHLFLTAPSTFKCNCNCPSVTQSATPTAPQAAHITAILTAFLWSVFVLLTPCFLSVILCKTLDTAQNNFNSAHGVCAAKGTDATRYCFISNVAVQGHLLSIFDWTTSLTWCSAASVTLFVINTFNLHSKVYSQ